MTDQRTFVRAYIGLGSNLADPRAQLAKAVEALKALPDSRVTALSRLYRSRPMGPTDQPDYLNAVAMLDTRLAAEALLDALQAIEKAQGRVRGHSAGDREHWIWICCFTVLSRSAPKG